MMYTKKIYFSGGDGQRLKEIFLKMPGVVSVEIGSIDGSIDGVAVEFNPKKIDLSMLMDEFFFKVDPYNQECGVHYASGEDEPQIEYYLNYVANRGRQPAVSCVGLTINDPMSNPRFARKCLARAARIKSFVARD